jgi:hypothetical protein
MPTHWQTIDSVPRDGSRVLLAWARGSQVVFPNPTFGRWNGLSPSDPRGGWTLDSGQRAVRSYAPTYWAPAPSAPMAHEVE